MTVYGTCGITECYESSGLLLSPDGSTICLLDTDYRGDEMPGLSLNTKMSDVMRAMNRSDSGLDVKDRVWLKLQIPAAFTGTNLVNWLYRNVHGLSDRREARKYAATLLKAGFIVSVVNTRTFSEQRYYQISPRCTTTIAPSHSDQYNHQIPTKPTSQSHEFSPENQKPSSRGKRTSWQCVKDRFTKRGSVILDSFHPKGSV